MAKSMAARFEQKNSLQNVTTNQLKTKVETLIRTSGGEHWRPVFFAAGLLPCGKGIDAPQTQTQAQTGREAPASI
jgi:hypothetical protein